MFFETADAVHIGPVRRSREDRLVPILTPLTGEEDLAVKVRRPRCGGNRAAVLLASTTAGAKRQEDECNHQAQSKGLPHHSSLGTPCHIRAFLVD